MIEKLKPQDNNEEEKLDEVVEALEEEGVKPNDVIFSNPNIGTKVAKVLNTFGVTPESVQNWLGIEECGCKKRQKFLNGVLSFLRPREEEQE
jgi:hypothetical protein